MSYYCMGPQMNLQVLLINVSNKATIIYERVVNNQTLC